MPAPTQADATLMIQLAQYQCDVGMSEAANWVRSDKFQSDWTELTQAHPVGSHEFELVLRCLNFYETVATLVKHHLVNEDLIFDWLSIDAAWERLQGIVQGMRTAQQQPFLYENFELAGHMQDAWRARLNVAAQARLGD